jgi:hypothetical protein
MTGFSDYSTPKVQEKFSLINDFLTSSGLFIEQLYSGFILKEGMVPFSLVCVSSIRTSKYKLLVVISLTYLVFILLFIKILF